MLGGVNPAQMKGMMKKMGISQVELARQIYRRQATISDIENGKSEISAGTIMLLAASLDKPVSYFFPRPLLKEIKIEDLDPDEQELIIQFRMITSSWTGHCSWHDV